MTCRRPADRFLDGLSAAMVRRFDEAMERCERLQYGEGFAFVRWHQVRWPEWSACKGSNYCLTLWYRGPR